MAHFTSSQRLKPSADTAWGVAFGRYFRAISEGCLVCGATPSLQRWSRTGAAKSYRASHPDTFSCRPFLDIASPSSVAAMSATSALPARTTAFFAMLCATGDSVLVVSTAHYGGNRKSLPAFSALPKIYFPLILLALADIWDNLSRIFARGDEAAKKEVAQSVALGLAVRARSPAATPSGRAACAFSGARR